MKRKNLAGRMPIRNALACILAALIWGIAFTGQSVGAEEMDSFAFVGLRFLMGAAVLLPVAAIRRKRNSAAERQPLLKEIPGGILCGLALGAATTLQQYGIAHVAVGKASFLTALYIIIVPCLSFLLTHRSKTRVWAAVLIAIVGLYFLCVEPGEAFSMGIWECALVGAAFVNAVQIMLVDHFTHRADAIELSFLQFLTAGIAGTLAALLRGTLILSGLSSDAVVSLLYVGIISSGIGFTLQVVGQKGADPAIASLLMSLEAPFGAIAGFVLLQQTLSRWELIGCVWMLVAIVLSQLPERHIKDVTGS